jgi:hypothetical protein
LLAYLGMLFKPFGKNDPRLKVSLEQPEPLIHFALVCGAKSCPPIKTYSANVSPYFALFYFLSLGGGNN